jgi:hypothetical protein
MSTYLIFTIRLRKSGIWMRFALVSDSFIGEDLLALGEVLTLCFWIRTRRVLEQRRNFFPPQARLKTTGISDKRSQFAREHDSIKPQGLLAPSPKSSFESDIKSLSSQPLGRLRFLLQ